MKRSSARCSDPVKTGYGRFSVPAGVKAPDGMRWCSRCEKYLPRNNFKNCPNALCLTHYREYDRAKQKRLTKKNPGRKSAAAVVWAKKNPDRIKEHQKRYGKKKIESGKNARQHRERIARDPEKARRSWRRSYRRKYDKDPAYFYFRHLRRRALRSNAAGTHSRQEVESLFKLFDYICLYCSSKATTVDHIIPLSSGGTNFVWNLGPACRFCNSKKGAIPPVEFIGNLSLVCRLKEYVMTAVKKHDQFMRAS